MEGMFNMWTGFIGWHVMQVDMYYWKYVVVVIMSIMRIFVMGGHVLQVRTEAAIIKDIVSLGNRCVCLLFFFCLQ